MEYVLPTSNGGSSIHWTDSVYCSTKGARVEPKPFWLTGSFAYSIVAYVFRSACFLHNYTTSPPCPYQLKPLQGSCGHGLSRSQ